MELLLKIAIGYAVLSACIGVVVVGMMLWTSSEHFFGDKSREEEEFLEESVEQGHLQKGVYGERVVYHENDATGADAVYAVEHSRYLKKHEPFKWGAIIGLYFGIQVAKRWPMMLFELFREFITRKRA